MARRTPLPPVRIGTSGWSYGHWRGRFYPEGLPRRRWLEHYVRHFSTVEVNSTFYHMPRETTMESWRGQAPDGFVYALKAPRLITHMHKLRGCEAPLSEFLRRARLLGDRLGPVLYQLPPSLECDLDLLDEFLQLLPPDLTSAFEFRNKSWYVDATFALLDARGVCFCSHDLPGRPSPRRATGPAVYVRFHGPKRRYTGAYSPEALADWAAWIGEQRCAGRAAYAYFNNDVGGHAVHDAQALCALVGGQSG